MAWAYPLEEKHFQFAIRCKKLTAFGIVRHKLRMHRRALCNYRAAVGEKLRFMQKKKTKLTLVCATFT